jgi:hypothetical protein
MTASARNTWLCTWNIRMDMLNLQLCWVKIVDIRLYCVARQHATLPLHHHLHLGHTEREKGESKVNRVICCYFLTKYSTKHICLSLVAIMHWSERKPRLSMRMDIFTDWLTAFWHGFKRASLYLQNKNVTTTQRLQNKIYASKKVTYRRASYIRV